MTHVDTHGLLTVHATEYADTFNLTAEQVEEFAEAFALFDENKEGHINPKQLVALLRALGQCPTESEVQMMLSSHEGKTPESSFEARHLPGADRFDLSQVLVDGRVGFKAALAVIANRMRDYDGSVCMMCHAQWSQLPDRCNVSDAYECRYLDATQLCCVFADYLGVRYETDTVPLSHALAVICGQAGSSQRGELMFDPVLLAEDALSKAAVRAEKLPSFAMALPRGAAEQIRKHIHPAICFFAGMYKRLAAGGRIPFFLRDLNCRRCLCAFLRCRRDKVGMLSALDAQVLCVQTWYSASDTIS